MQQDNPYRIVIRNEGTMVNVYVSRINTMENAVLIFSIRGTLHATLSAEFTAFVRRCGKQACSELGIGHTERIDIVRLPDEPSPEATVLFNPYTGRPRYPSDIRDDPFAYLLFAPCIELESV
jgi:hypothetical protein